MESLPVDPVPGADWEFLSEDLWMIETDPTRNGVCLLVAAKVQRPEFIVDEGVSHIIPTTYIYREHLLIATDERHGSDGRWYYSFKIWPDHKRVSKRFDLQPESFTQLQAEAVAERREQRIYSWTLLIELLVGWLPGRIQQNISKSWPIRVDRATVMTLFLLYIPTGYFTVVMFAAGLTTGLPTGIALLVIYGWLDSTVRLIVIVVGHPAIGTLIFELVDAIYVAVAKALGREVEMGDDW